TTGLFAARQRQTREQLTPWVWRCQSKQSPSLAAKLVSRLYFRTSFRSTFRQGSVSETRDSPQIPAGHRPVRVRQHVCHALEHAQLDEIRQTHQRIERLEAELGQAQEVLADKDPELAQLARADVDRLRPEIDRLEAELAELLTPSDPFDDRDAIVEIRAGTGGDEAALFAADLFRMYTRFSERRGWKVDILSLSEGTLGGLKEAVFAARGPKAYGTLRYESGVHRVQRVPVTEQQGRIHTSAATVAVLPEAEEVDVKIEDKDIR